MIKKEQALALVLLGAASGMALWTIRYRPVWFDEGWTWHAARMSLGDGVRAAARDRYPPLHPLIYHLWMRAAGDSELSLRWPSVAFGLLTMAFAWRLHRQVWGPSWTGALAIVGIALSPLWLEQMRQARMYTQLSFFVLLSWWAMERWIKRPIVRNWILWVLSGLGALLTHYYAIFPIVVGAALQVYARRSWRGLVEAGTALAAIGVGTALWVLLGQIRLALFLPEEHIPSLPQFLAATNAALRSSALAYWGAMPPIGWALLLLTVLVNLGPHASAVQKRWFLFTGLGIALPIVVMAGGRGNLLNFAPRHILYAHPLVAMGWAGGVARLLRWSQRRPARPVRIGLAGAIWTASLIPVGYAGRSAWALLQAEANSPRAEEAAVRYLRSRAGPGDVVLTLRGHWGIRYYWQRWQPPAELREGPQGPVLTSADPSAWLSSPAQPCSGSHRIWIIGWQEEFVDPLGWFPAWLLWNGWEEDVQNIAGLSVRGYNVSCVLKRPPEPEGDLSVVFQNGIHLRGFRFRPPHPRDRLLGVMLTWERTLPLHGFLKVFIHIHDEKGNLVAQEDFPLARGFLNIARWPLGQPMTVFAAVRIPDALKPGSYAVRVGLYDPETMARVRIQQSSIDPDAWLLAILPAEFLNPPGPRQPSEGLGQP